MSLNYTSYVSQVSNLMVIPSSDPNFTTMLPGMIDYAEQRIYRELDLLNTTIVDSTTVSSGNQNFTLPTNIGAWTVVEQINILSSAGTTSSNGNRNPVLRTTRDLIDMVYPSGQNVTGVPQYWATVTSTYVVFGPAPDQAYTAEVIGEWRPAALSSANSSTIITQYIPDVFVAASMVFGFAYMRDFGGMSDNPQAGQTWETQYQTLMKSAYTEQMRDRFQSEGWTPKMPNIPATPPRA